MITMKDIAEKAGVSRTTVSFVLNGRCHKDQRISESVQRKVLATAEKLGYIKNDLVLSLVKGRSYAVGIVSEFKNFTFPIIRGYAQEAQNHLPRSLIKYSIMSNKKNPLTILLQRITRIAV